jgi:hypothetical protein
MVYWSTNMVMHSCVKRRRRGKALKQLANENSFWTEGGRKTHRLPVDTQKKTYIIYKGFLISVQE